MAPFKEKCAARATTDTNVVAHTRLSPSTIPELLSALVRQCPERIALADARHQLTFLDLETQTNQIACFLQRHGVGPQARVGLCSRLSINLVKTLFGVLKAGATCVLLDGALPRTMPVPELVIVENTDKYELPEAWRSVKVVSFASLEQELAGLGDALTPQLMDSGNTAFCFVEHAGTTVQHHLATSDRVRALEELLPLADPPRVVCKRDDVFAAPLCVLPWLLRGASMFLVPDADTSTNSFITAVQLNQPSVVCLPPRDLPSFFESLQNGNSSLQESVRYLIVEGEFPAAEMLRKYAPLPFELFIIHSLPEAGGPLLISQLMEKRSGGFSTRGVAMDIYVLDERLRPVPPGVEGEVFVYGDSSAHAYLDDPVRTAQSMVPHPFSDAAGKRLLRTDTSARWRVDGTMELRHFSRRGTWFRNRRVSLPEIEKTVLQDPAFDDCYVVPRTLREGNTVLVCYVVSADPFDSGELQMRLLRCLPPAMVPDLYVPVAKLPLLPSGTVDEQQLTEIEVLVEEVCTEWKRQLDQREGDEIFTVVAGDFEAENPAVHLSDVIPFWKSRIHSASTNTPAVKSAGGSSGAAKPEAGHRLAQTSGGPLMIDPKHPRTLQEGFLRAAASEQRRTVTYIGSNGSVEELTYGQLLTMARRILGGLSKRGLQRGDKVILQIDKVNEFIPAFWACILGGICPVTVAIPGSYDQSNAVTRKLASTYHQLEHPPVLASDSVATEIMNLGSAMHMRDLTVIALADVRDSDPQEQFCVARPEDVAFFQLTSGSTGVPKVIQETNIGVLAHIHGSMQFNHDRSDDVTLNWLPMDHVGPLLMCLCKDSYLGRAQVQVPTELIISRPLLWLDLIEKYRVAFTWAPNFAYKLVIEALKQEVERKWDLSSLRYFFNAGEQVTPLVVTEFLERLGRFGVAAKVMQPAYGMAETCTAITYLNNFDIHDGIRHYDKNSLAGTLTRVESPGAATLTFVGVGAPIPGVDLRIVGEGNRLISERQIGRLQVRGSVVTPGYFNNPEANAEAFTEDGWFNTGDLGFLWDGNLTITGREKETIIINGANYHCHEIEDLVGQIPGVEPTWVAACGVGNGETESLAIFFCASSHSFGDQASVIPEIKKNVTSRIGITPEYVVPISKEMFPKTTSGKIQRSQLKKSLIQGEYSLLLKQIDLHLQTPNTIPDWFYSKIWRRKRNRNLPSRAIGGNLAIFVEGGFDPAEQLIRRMEAAGVSCIRVEAGQEYARSSPLTFQINPDEGTDYDRLLHTLVESCLWPDKIAYFCSCDSLMQGEAPAEDLRHELRVLRLCKALEKRRSTFRKLDLHVISSQAQFVKANDQMRWELASLPGLLKSLSLELDWLRIHHIDVDLEQDAIPDLVRELQQEEASDSEVAYRKGQRYIARLQKAKLRPGEAGMFPLQRGGLYLITGGLGALGSRIAQYLVEEWDCKVVLMGRGVLSPKRAETSFEVREDGESIFWNLLNAGKPISYCSADVSDRDAVVRAITDTVGAKAALSGIFHLAGSFQEAPLTEVTEASFKTVASPKTTGTRLLFELLDGRPETLFVCFSSLSGFFGGLCLPAYAAASSFMEAFCAFHAQKPGPKVYGFSWNFWGNLGMSHNLASRKFAGIGVGSAMSFSQGLYSLLAGLAANPGHLFAGLSNSQPRIRRHIENHAYANLQLRAYYTRKPLQVTPNDLRGINVPDPFGQPTSCLLLAAPRTSIDPSGRVDLAGLKRGNSSGAHHGGPSTSLERQLALLWQEVLKVPSVGLEDDFFELGGHSLSAVKMLARLRESFGVDFTMHDFFASRTVAEMAGHIEAMRLRMASGPTMMTTPTSGVERGEI